VVKGIGDIGEQLALEFLKRNGYKLYDRNLRLGHWEADLVVFKGQLLVIAEVKSSIRRTAESPEARISRAQIARLIGLGTFLVRRNPQFLELRIDLLLVHLKIDQSEVKHFEDISSYI
jgi:putative endonuclease